MISNKPIKISVASRFKIENKEFDSSHVVISMADDEEYFPNILEKNCHGILKIAVWDTEDGTAFRSMFNYDASEIPKDKIFNSTHAKKILKFVSKHLNDVSSIICQCDMGLSRSAATAAALSKILNGNDEEFFESPFIPNKLIYETILDEYRNMKKEKDSCSEKK